MTATESEFSASASIQPTSASCPPVRLAPEVVAAHAYAVAASGYTVLPRQLDDHALEELRAIVDEALAQTQRAIADGRAGSHTRVDASYQVARRLYRWGEAAYRLLEHESVHACAERIFGGLYQLFDLTAQSCIPTAGERLAGTGWHRDFIGGPDRFCLGTPVPTHLFALFCLDDWTAQNGATWVVPGSHRTALQPEPSPGPEQYPSAMQICAHAGDCILLDPAALHASGRNATAAPRRMASLALCHARISPAADHWATLGPLQDQASQRVRTLTQYRWAAHHAAWAVLPNGEIAGPP